jgi:hypothetical protein
MNPLQARLAALRRRLRLVVSFRGLCLLTAFLVVGVVLAGGLDWLVHLPSLVRAVLLVGLLTGAVLLAARHLVLPLLARADDLSLALQVEARYPGLNDALASTVQFLEQPADAPWAGSPSLRREAVQQAVRKARDCDFNKVVSSRGVVPAGLAVLAAGAAAVLLVLADPLLAWTALVRLAEPFAEHDWPRETQIAVHYDDVVPAGRPFAVRGEVSGVVPEQAEVEFDGLAGGRRVHEVDLARGKGAFRVSVDMSRQQGNFRFRVRANDAFSPARRGTWHEVTVVQPPELTSLQVRLRYPAYTDLPAEDIPSGYETIEEPLVAGTAMTFRGVTDRPIARAWVEFEPADGKELALRAAAASFGADQSLGGAVLLAGVQALDRKTPAALAADGKHFTLELLPRLSGRYHLHWRDERGVGDKRSYAIRLKADPPPEVKLECLSLVREAAAVTANATLSLRVVADDPEYAVRSAFLEYRRKDNQGRDLDPDWRRLPLYDHAAAGQAVPRLVFAGLSGLPAGDGPALRLRPRHLEILRPWPIQGLVREGDTLLVRAAADDFDDVLIGKEPGRSSPPLELLIAGPEQVKEAVQEAVRQVRDDLTALTLKQEKALKKVMAAEQQLRATGKLRPEDVRDLLDAREEQKKIQDRIGKDAGEMLQKDVDRIRRALADNKLPRSSVHDKMDNAARSLKRLADERLPRLQEQVDKALKDAEDAAAKGRSRRQRLRDLADLRRRQRGVQDTLQGLLTDLSPYVTVQEMRGKARGLLREQNELRKDTEALAKAAEKAAQKRRDLENEQANPPNFQRRQELPGDFKRLGEKEQQLKAEREKIADRQARLGQRAKQLIGEMTKAAEDQRKRAEKDPAGEQGPKDPADPHAARLLEEAAKRGTDKEVDRQMQRASDKVRGDKLFDAQQQQRGSAQTLQEMIGAMDERREDDLARLSKRQQKEQDNLDALREEMEGLRKKTRAARQIKDRDERARQLRKLADRQRELQEKVDEMVRRLSRLQAEEAAEELRRASRRMEEAARQMDDGENPEKKQQDALDRLQQADQKLQKANDRVENELARERLAKIADFIKRLKARQDAAGQESSRIHSEVVNGSRWSHGLAASLSKLRRDRQAGITTETRQVRKKVENAPVFAHILGKAVAAMEKAEARMGEHLRAARDLQDGEKLAPEQLAEENRLYGETRRFQREASRRLARLLDALKQDPAGVPPAGQPGQQGGGGGGEGGGPPPANRDGIPSLAEQKALRAEQEEVNERTQDFDRRHPELAKMTDEEKLNRLPPKGRAELQEILDDQKKVHALAEELFRAARKEGEKP